MKHLKIVENNRASTGVRFLNHLIDSIFVSALMFSYGAFAGILFGVLGDNFIYSSVLWMGKLHPFEEFLFSSVVYFFYIFLFELLTKGRSLGKLITGSKAVDLEGNIPSNQHFFIRNICRLVPFNALSFLGNNGWHDTWSDTRVINIKMYEEEKNRQNDLSQLGNN